VAGVLLTPDLSQSVRSLFFAFTGLNSVAPHICAYLLVHILKPSSQACTLTSCFSLMLIGMFLSTLATLNFSLSFLIGLLAAPLSFVRKYQQPKAITLAASLLLNALSPPVVILVACRFWGWDLAEMLTQAAMGWHVWGLRTQLIVWLVWWPAWFAGAVLLASSMYA
jgi:GPI-anchor transamidase subunit GAA1